MATLIGTGSHGRDIMETLDDWAWRWVPHHSEYQPDDEGWEPVIIGINDPRLRADVAAQLKIHELEWVHPDAILNNGSFVGSGTHVNYGVTMTRTTIGHHCTLSPGVTCCGDVVIGDRVLIGAGAVIGDRVRIGDDVTIGMGAVVLPETVIPGGETWVGVPAKKLR
jgi:carbonic anhydrase/acetyltransferase-like protein (isoleucine patch superfamily)